MVATGEAAKRPETTVPRPKGPRKERVGKYYLLLAPALLLSISVVLIPGLLTGYFSFTDWNGISANPEWIGFENFRRIFADEVFWKAFVNNLKWTALFLTLPVAAGLGAALLLVRRTKSRNVYQIIFLIPYVLAAITNAVIWLNVILNPVSGMIGYLRDLGLEIDAPLGNLNTALYAVALVDIWHFWGFLTIVYLAALRQVPTDQMEAAMVEGANGRQLFRYVYYPNIKPTMQLMFVMIMIFSFLTFDYVWLMTGGGPAHATEMLSTYAYSFAFASFQFGRAAAVGLLMSGFGLLASFFYTWLSRKDVLT